MVGAVLQPAGAQVRDTAAVRRDTSAKKDSTGRDSTQARDAKRDSVPPRDTIKAPLAESELPVLADPGGSYHWTRATMFERGALTVQDLLDRTPGLTSLRANWISQPMASAYLGDLRRIRIFLDGFELEEMDPRANRVWDLSQIPLWSLDDVFVERSAGEIRLYMRSWRVDRTTPFTRTDIYTGDLNTNLYRGLFGRRYAHGEVLQLAGQQFSTNAGRFADNADQLGLMSRIGIGRRNWTADAVMMRQGRHRGLSFPITLSDTVPSTETSRTDAFLRLAVGKPTAGLWIQGLAGTSSYVITPQKPASSGTTTTTATDTTRTRSQYVLTGGYTRGPVRASFTQRFSALQRFFEGAGRRVATPSARVGLDTRRVTLSAFGEGRSLDSTRRFDVSAIVRPVNFIYFGVGVGSEQPLLDSAGSPTFSRLEGGVRVGDAWVSLGSLRRSGVELERSPIVSKRSLQLSDSGAHGVFATVRGRVWKAVYLDAYAVRWSDTTGSYRPEYQTRSELYLSTSALKKFPSGNFHVRAAIAHEYRSSLFWPDTAGAIRVPGFRTLSTQLQFKIVSAEVFWTYRNALTERYAEIPGYRLPGITSVYGIRWEFWN